jgi:hypothetical protein
MRGSITLVERGDYSCVTKTCTLLLEVDTIAFLLHTKLLDDPVSSVPTSP